MGDRMQEKDKNKNTNDMKGKNGEEADKNMQHESNKNMQHESNKSLPGEKIQGDPLSDKQKRHVDEETV